MSQPNPESWPVFDDEMVDAVQRVLRSGRVNYWTGDEGVHFECEFADYIGVKHAIAVANGTVALELALRALGIGPGDEVIVPSRTFVATASSVAAVGARPVFADIDRDSQNLTVETISPQLSQHTRAIIAVHLSGWPCDMQAITNFASQHKISVVEDCAQAHGAEIDGRRVGSFGAAAAFSFCQDKILTTGGEGGMLTTNRDDLFDQAWRYKDHGKAPALRTGPRTSGGSFRWVHDTFGSNCRLSEMQSAVGRVQLRRLPEWLKARENNASRLAAACTESGLLRVPEPPPSHRHANYKFYAFVRPELLAAGWDRDRLIARITEQGVACSMGSCSEVYRETAVPDPWKPRERLPIAKELGETALILQIHPTLSHESVTHTADVIRNVMSLAANDAGETKGA